jgi:hypothetical protein
MSMLTAETASRFAAMALANVTREYPNKMDHVMTGPADIKGPRALHPIFYGSFDWHSCVHGYWLLVRVLRRFPQGPEARAIVALINEHFTADNVAVECRYLADPAHRTFERPYGLAWLVMLAGELARHDSAHARVWTATLEPLAAACLARLTAYFAAVDYPIRAGTHTNGAFALALAQDYADARREAALTAQLGRIARAWFLKDGAGGDREPDGEDFLSPALMEAACLSRALPAPEFLSWLGGFLPHLAAREPACLFRPARVSDRTDPRIVHLDGLNLSRAWCWRILTDVLPAGDPRRAIAMQAAADHLGASLDQIGHDYAGSHWLATFALLALDFGRGD